MDISVNLAKFFRPINGPDIIRRDQLWKLLNNGIRLPLTLISAPAGYGKSTLVSSWLEQIDSKYIWISLEKEDSDLSIFLRNFIRGIRKLQPEFGFRLEKLLETPQPTNIEKISSEFINSLSQLDQKMILVLDDYHTIDNQDIHELISNYLKYPNKYLNLLLCARSDPPIRIQEIRLKGWLQDIRARDLVFDQGEIIEFLSSKITGELSDIDLKNILRITDGWPTGVRLLTFQNEDPEKFKERLFTYARNDLFYLDIVKNYLAKNQALEEFVLMISCLSQFNHDLCDYVASKVKLDSWDAKTHIDILINDNFFIIPLDDNNYNYRFHHLIQTHLYNQSLSIWGDDKISSIHCMSAEWYKNHNQPSLAIEHFIKGKDFENALGLFKVYRLQLHREMDWSSLKYILNLFPDSVSKTSAEIQLSKAWLLIYTGDLIEMFSMFGQIDEIISADESGSLALEAELKSLQVYELYNLSQDYDQCVEACSFAIKHLPKEHVYALGYAWIFLGAAMQITHSTTIAVQKIKQGIAEDNDLTVKSHQWLTICSLYWISGENELLIRSSQSLVELGLKSNNLEALANGYYFQGMAHFACGDINKAKEILLEFYELRYSSVAVIHFMAMAVLSKCLFVLSEDAHLNSVLNKMTDLIYSQRDVHFRQMLEILRAEFNLSKGHNKLAISQVNKLRDVLITPLSNFYSPQIAMARILLMSNSASELNYAKSLISQLEEIITKTKNGRFIVNLLLLKSESALRTEDQAFAEHCAEKAIRIANTHRYLSPFLEISDELLKIVEAVSKLKFPGFYKPLKRLLSNLNSENTTQIPSNREVEVLKLLKENLTNKQIANALYISEKTVKRHCSNLFKKLGVKNRREATIKFQSLDLTHQN